LFGFRNIRQNKVLPFGCKPSEAQYNNHEYKYSFFTHKILIFLLGI